MTYELDRNDHMYIAARVRAAQDEINSAARRAGIKGGDVENNLLLDLLDNIASTKSKLEEEMLHRLDPDWKDRENELLEIYYPSYVRIVPAEDVTDDNLPPCTLNNLAVRLTKIADRIDEDMSPCEVDYFHDLLYQAASELLQRSE